MVIRAADTREPMCLAVVGRELRVVLAVGRVHNLDRIRSKLSDVAEELLGDLVHDIGRRIRSFAGALKAERSFPCCSELRPQPARVLVYMGGDEDARLAADQIVPLGERAIELELLFASPILIRRDRAVT